MIDQKQILYVHQVPDHCDRFVWRGKYHSLPVASPADAQAEIARLRGALSALELSANTVARCYTHRPENFASALQSLESDASAARELLK